MKKVPGKKGEEEEKFSRYTPTVDLSEESEGKIDIQPVVLSIEGLPERSEQAHDLSLQGDESG